MHGDALVVSEKDLPQRIHLALLCLALQGLLLAMGLTKAEVVDALTKHMMNAAVSEQEQQEATELLVEIQDWGDDEADACNKVKKLHDSLRGQTRNIFWAVRALHKQQQVAAQQQAAPGPSQQQAAPGSPQATSGNTFRIVIGAGFTVVVVCTVGLTATIIDAINFGKDYVARHDPTFNAAVGGVGVATTVLNAVGQATDRVARFLVPVAGTVTVIKKLFSNGQKPSKDQPSQQTSTTTTTTTGSPATSSGAASTPHPDSNS